MVMGAKEGRRMVRTGRGGVAGGENKILWRGVGFECFSGGNRDQIGGFEEIAVKIL